MRKKEIRILADSFREKCKISRYGIMDLFKECDRRGYQLIRYPLGKDSDLGFVTKRDNETIIFTNSSIRLSREIFTLAHEIGHIVLHMDKNDSFIDNEVTFKCYEDEMEQEANYFAACLLMPADEVNRFLDLEIEDYKKNRLTALDIARMMSEFNVSFEMVLNRLVSLGIIDELEKARLDNDKNALRVGNLLKNSGSNSSLNKVSGVVDIPYVYLNYAIYNYNHLAIPEETLGVVLECYHLTMDDISDRIKRKKENEDDSEEKLDELIGGLPD